MASLKKVTTTLSTKGQVILPKPVRDRLHWEVGTRLQVEDTEDGVLLRPSPVFPPTRVEDVYGCLRYDGPPKTLAEMDAGIVAEGKRRYARDRY